ncbi:unannotated protein [freshwater metagenome]|uniref:Unannotated protein n=1 Tax=freshwater metagenome TaxID=449393 RepID=A0A6J7AVD5_9ZZZZ
MFQRPSEHIEFSVELPVLLGTGDRRRLQFLHLEAQQVDFTHARPAVTTQRRERGSELGEVSPRRAQRLQIRTAEAVERVSLIRRRQQALMRVLTMDIDTALSEIDKVAHRRQPAVHIGARTTVRRYHPGDDVLLVSDHETAFHSCLSSAGAHHGCVGAATHQQADRLDQHGLACAGLTRQRGKAGPEHEVEMLDHPERFDVQLQQHSAIRQPELGLQNLVEATLAEANEPRHLLRRHD